MQKRRLGQFWSGKRAAASIEHSKIRTLSRSIALVESGALFKRIILILGLLSLNFATTLRAEARLLQSCDPLLINGNYQQIYLTEAKAPLGEKISKQSIADLSNDGVPIRETPLVEPTVVQSETSAVDLSGLEQVSIQLTGPMCSVCLRRLEGRLITLPGIALAKFSHRECQQKRSLKIPVCSKNGLL